MADEKWWKQHYLVTAKSKMLNGRMKFVNFKNGRGILDTMAIAECHPNWFESDESGYFKPLAKRGPWQLTDYVGYFERAGCTVEPIPASKAKKIRAELAAESVEMAIHETPAAAEPEKKTADPPKSDTGSGDVTEKAFKCQACNKIFTAVDVGVYPIDCPLCGKTAGIPKKKTGTADK